MGSLLWNYKFLKFMLTHCRNCGTNRVASSTNTPKIIGGKLKDCNAEICQILLITDALIRSNEEVEFVCGQF